MNKDIYKNIEETVDLLQAINSSDAVEFSKWIKDKANLRYKGQTPKFPIYNNFIYWCNFGINIGSEQDKLRPAIIVKTFKASPLCTVIPLTSKRLDDQFWFHIDLEDIDSTALIEQLKTVSKLRMVQPFRKKGRLVTISKKDWDKINSQLDILYRLRPLKKCK